MGLYEESLGQKYVEVVETLKNYSKKSNRKFLKVNILENSINPRRTWGLTQRSKASTSTRIYWTLNTATKVYITKT